MYEKAEVWLRVFTAALQAFLHRGDHTNSNALSQARAVADESMGHLHPDLVFPDEPPVGAADSASAPTPAADVSYPAPGDTSPQQAIHEPL
jgi:hypothetical protein